MNGRVHSRKNLFKISVFSWILLSGMLLAGLSARWFTSITRSEQTNEIFNAAATPPPELLESVIWQPDASDLKRQMEPLTRVEVTSAWIRAWEQLSIVAQTGDLTGLEVYFANSALEGLLASVEDTSGHPVHQLGHRLKLDFYSQDGQVIGLTAQEVQLLRSVNVDGVLGWMETTESYEAILLLEDGNWRIQHWVRRDATGDWWTDPAPDGLVSLAPGRSAPDAQGPESQISAGQISAGESGQRLINGVNYYPRDTPFDLFWPNYQPAVVDQDLALIADAGFDTVRIFLPFDGLGGRWTTDEDLAPVIAFMDQADASGLGVVVTLFDGRTDHRPAKWQSDTAHVNAVVLALQGHPALRLWDLKNEPDRDIGANGVDEQLLYAWLGHIARDLRALDPVTPMTVGWSTPEAALAAPVHTDVVSFHFYGPADGFPGKVDALIEHADGRPVLLSEFGLPTWNSIFPGGHTEVEQARYIADVMGHADQAGLVGAMVWTLWDLAEAPKDAGSMPWRTGPQRELGLLRPDGSPKPAFAVVHPETDLGAVEYPGITNRLGKNSWRLFIAICACWLGLIGLSRTVRTRRVARSSAVPRP